MDSLYNRYAIALFDLSLEKDKINECQEESRILYNALFENEEIIHILSSCFLSKSEKIKIANVILVDFKQEDFINFVRVIIDNGREKHILRILKEFDNICNEHLGVKTGDVFSPYKITEEQINEIEKVVGKKIGFKVKLKNKTDESLIGGVKVVVGDYVFDNSIKNKLLQMRSTLLKGGN
jgi:F-type H+-transporting ATPase subunit delta